VGISRQPHNVFNLNKYTWTLFWYVILSQPLF